MSAGKEAGGPCAAGLSLLRPSGSGGARGRRPGFLRVLEVGGREETHMLLVLAS